MKIIDILREYEIDYKQKKVKKPPVVPGDTEKFKRLGSGYFSVVGVSDDSPQDVVKVNMYGDLKDGYNAFVKALIDNERARNSVLFPRIRSVRELKTPEDEYPRLLVRMERLEPLFNLGIEELRHMVARYTSAKVEDLEYNNDKFDMINLFVDIIRGDSLVSAKVTDTKLKNAIQWLQEIAQEEKFFFDLHSENMMVRRTPYGPQLVLSDPLGLSR